MISRVSRLTFTDLFNGGEVLQLAKLEGSN